MPNSEQAIGSIEQLLQEYIFVLATGKLGMIEAYANGYGSGVHSVNPENNGYEEPVTETPKEATDHKVLAVMLHAKELKQGLQGTGLENKPVAIFGSDVITRKGYRNPDNNEIEWTDMYRADREYDSNNPAHVAELRQAVGDDFEGEEFWVNWRMAWTFVAEGEKDLERTVVASLFACFPNGIPTEDIDHEFEDDLPGVFSRGPRLDLTRHVAKQQLSVNLATYNQEITPDTIGVEIPVELLEMLVVDRYICPQALLAVLNQPERQVDAFGMIPELQVNGNLTKDSV